MNIADAHGRRAEVQAAFLEGWRKALLMRSWFTSDREAWETSDAFARLAYGVFPPCPKCRCQIINVHSGNPPKCLKCGEVRAMPTEQTLSREAVPHEADLGERMVAHPLMRAGDGYDQHQDRRDGR